MDAQTAVELALRVVAEREPVVRAWTHLDTDGAAAAARAIDARPETAGPRAGAVLGVKDVFDSADQPTEYGSAIFKGHRRRADPGAVDCSGLRARCAWEKR